MDCRAAEKSEVLLQTIGTAIAARRCAKGWSQEYLAAQIPITPSKLSRIECGKANAKMITLIRIGQALGVTLDELLGTQTVEPAKFENILADFSAAERHVIFDVLESAQLSIQKYLK